MLLAGDELRPRHELRENPLATVAAANREFFSGLFRRHVNRRGVTPWIVLHVFVERIVRDRGSLIFRGVLGDRR